MKNTKYSFWLPSSVALFDRQLSPQYCGDQGSGLGWGFFLNHGDTKTQSNTEECFCIATESKPLLRGMNEVVGCDESKPASRQSVYTTIKHTSSIINLILFFLLIILFFFSSCEKVIDVNLKEADKQIVIEGNVSYNGNAFPEVRISQTKAFEDDNAFNGVSGAVVSIQVNKGNTYNLLETQKGIYTSTQFGGEPDSVYTLTVQLNGNTYTSVSHLPAQVVTLDSLWAEGLVFGGSTNITIYPKYNDPKGIGNSYRLVEYANDTLVRRVFAQNDKFSDGNTVTRPLINPDSDLKEGDSIMVELQCIDADVYKYWYSLDAAATGNNQSATPTNPVTNISGGALGYFSAYSATRYSFRIP